MSKNDEQKNKPADSASLHKGAGTNAMKAGRDLFEAAVSAMRGDDDDAGASDSSAASSAVSSQSSPAASFPPSTSSGSSASQGSPASPGASATSSSDAKLVEYENDLRRLAAEFDNYKKRAEREKQAARLNGRAEALSPFLELMETFEHARAASEKADVKSLKEGMHLMQKKLHSIFSSSGVREITCHGLPNHAFHDVMLQVPGSPGGEIAQCLRKGYVMGEHVLRPAQVSVYIGEKKAEPNELQAKNTESEQIENEAAQANSGAHAPENLEEK